MQLVLDDVLSPAEVAQLLALLRSAPAGEGWVEGVATSGQQSAPAKNNQQMPEQGRVTAQARERVVAHISRHPQFMTAALPRRLYPPSFNRYAGQANAFGAHIDNAMRHIPGTPGFLRTDLSCTLFLSDPKSYEGGELVIESPGGEQAYKLAAGSLVLYPASTVHRVNPVTQGERVASFFWVESMVRSAEQRQLLYELDLTITAQRTRELQTIGQESEESIRLTGTYHNLLRMWAQP
jgi:PKHD-type hydroxylase